MGWRKTGLGLIAAAVVLAGANAEARPRPQRVRPPVVRPRVALPRVQSPPRTRLEPRANAGELPQNWVEQLQEMKPSAQQKFLKNNERFNSLPPDQQSLIR